MANVADKPLLASAAAVATPLLWINIGARVTLIAAAWTAGPPATPKLTKDMLRHQDHTPNYVSVSAPESIEWDCGALTGLVQPLEVEHYDYSPTLAAVAAKQERREAQALGEDMSWIEPVKSQQAAVNQPDRITIRARMGWSPRSMRRLHLIRVPRRSCA